MNTSNIAVMKLSSRSYVGVTCESLRYAEGMSYLQCKHKLMINIIQWSTARDNTTVPRSQAHLWTKITTTISLHTLIL